MRLRFQLVSIAAVAGAVASGCGGGSGGQPDRYAGVRSYDAAVQARKAMADEELDAESIAYGKTLLVGDAFADQLSDGQDAWRVHFTTIDDQPSDICIWIWLESATPLRENYGYTIDPCPVDAGA